MSESESSLFISVIENQLKKVKILIEDEYIDINSIDTGIDGRGKTALHYACQLSRYEIVLYLVEGGADINQMDHNEKTPLYYAVTGGWIEIVKFLINNKCEMNCLCNKYCKETVLHVCAKMCIDRGSNHFRILMYMLCKGADVKKKNEKGKLPSEISQFETIRNVFEIFENGMKYEEICDLVEVYEEHFTEANNKSMKLERELVKDNNDKKGGKVVNMNKYNRVVKKLDEANEESRDLNKVLIKFREEMNKITDASVDKDVKIDELEKRCNHLENLIKKKKKRKNLKKGKSYNNNHKNTAKLDDKKCTYCKKELDDSLMRCSRCKTLYCSRICQTNDWKLNKHKVLCEKLQKTQSLQQLKKE